jgi:hypothetical protein
MPYLVTHKEGDETYYQKWYVVIKSKHFWFKMFLVFIDDKTFLKYIHEDLMKHSLVVISIKGHFTNSNWIQNLANDYDKLEQTPY